MEQMSLDEQKNIKYNKRSKKESYKGLIICAFMAWLITAIGLVIFLIYNK
ncbi:MAG: hypothetical protein ACRC2K_08990 [Clostridium sp.]